MRRPPQEPAHGSLHAVETSLQEPPRFCPLDCVELHTELVMDSSGCIYATRCELCGMIVQLRQWNDGMVSADRPWSRHAAR
jgi:ferredoxin-like protein FixX